MEKRILDKHTYHHFIKTMLLLFSAIVFSNCSQINQYHQPLHIPNANSHTATYFSVHYINEVQRLTNGEGIKIGVMDHLFGLHKHGDLYAGAVSFQNRRITRSSNRIAEHGFWMASTLREVAPEAEIFALTTYATDEESKVEAMFKAIEWAIQNDIDILTYSAERISDIGRNKLQPILDEAYRKGLITVLLHHPDPRNILVSEIEPPIDGEVNQADFEIFKYDYSTFFPGRFLDSRQSSRTLNNQHYLSISSKAPVTAGIVALLLSANPAFHPTDIESLLRRSCYTYEDDWMYLPNALNAESAMIQIRVGLNP